MAISADDHRPSDVVTGVSQNRPWMLAIDTATEQAGVALFDGFRVVEMSWPGGRRHTTTVLPVVESLLAIAGVDMDRVGGVAVATGPGSFTGLRVGMSLAKGLVITGDCVLVGIPTLDVAASLYRAVGMNCIALAPAGRSRVVWSSYSAGGDPTPPVNTTFDEFLEVLPRHPDHVVAGELTPSQREAVLRIHTNLSSPAMSTRRPSLLAELGYRRWVEGNVDEPTALEPLYLHGQPNPR